MNKSIHRGFVLVFIFVILLTPCLLKAADLVWQLSKQDAVNMAQQQGKKILLVAGRDT
jgi:hypothetical protein